MRLILIILCTCLLGSCTQLTRDFKADKSKLKGNDYRLFQDTPAWQLAKAVQDGNEKKIRKILVENKKLIDYQEPKYGQSLLHLTINNKQFKSFKMLLENKANVNIYDTFDGCSPIIEASYYGDVRFVKKLVEYGANINDIEVGKRRVDNGTRNTPLIMAAGSGLGQMDVVKYLVEQGADINYENEFHRTALAESIILDNYDIAYYLLEHGADYTRPVVYRYVGATTEKIPISLIDNLRESLIDLDTERYSQKMQIVKFLKDKGIDYWSTPISEATIKEAKRRYPDTWEEYLKRY